jgi:molybdopterin molybdotransferase
VLATGDELVPAGETPGLGRIRDSNGPMLAALVRRAGARPVALGVARDDEDHLRALVLRGLKEDVLLLSGGVSAGTRDLVPQVLAVTGVKAVFHKVRLKPGKPLWFGVRPAVRPSYPDTLVFGLPGNPVSSLVCFELLVRPALAQLAGMPSASPHMSAVLAAPHSQRGDRPTFFPAEFLPGRKPIVVRTLPWKGSADLQTLAKAHCLICFPAGDRDFLEGDTVEIRLL